MSDTGMAVLTHYRDLFQRRFGRPPKDHRTDLVLARTLVKLSGGENQATAMLDAWFRSQDPWYAKEGFRLAQCFPAANRMLGTGELDPWAGSGEERELTRKLARRLVERHLRIVR